MRRTKREDGGTAEPKKRSRTGCWPCKNRKVKCDEQKPACGNCVKNGEKCDYSIRLNWAGRSRRDKDGTLSDANGFTFVATPTSVSKASGHEHVFSSQHIATTRPGTTSLEPKQFEGMPASVEWSPQGTSKRMRLSPQGTSAQPSPRFIHNLDHTSPSSNNYTPPSINSVVHTPATPGSSLNSGSPHPLPTSYPIQQETLDLRRLSVRSLLSDPDELERSRYSSMDSHMKELGRTRYPTHDGHAEELGRPKYPRMDSHGCRTYGYDHGRPDYDIPHNDDRAAIQQKSPEMRRPSASTSEVSNSSFELDQRDIAFEPGGYYAKPVAIRIPRILEPLPQELQDNSMNLLYFHHFINHTARIMVPHDCPENPMRRVLPQMAVRNRQLLHLMLAFSASHRAQLLGHSEPLNRIAEWMDDVLPALRTALTDNNDGPIDPNDLASLAPLATAIMLASLEIISPNTFAVPISWQNHLDVARSLLVSKGGLQRLAVSADGARDKAVFLISRWFAYLDVLGSLSGGKHRRPLKGAYFEDGGGHWLVNRNDDEIFQIDCFFGFSGRCIALLAGVADLAASCDRQRIDAITGRHVSGWQPCQATREQAAILRRRLMASAEVVYAGCMHTEVDGGAGSAATKSETDRDEIVATNQAFHWAGMLHLSRRVLGLAREHAEVQDGVRKIIDSLGRVRQGSTAESCLLFPMFTAGCECITQHEQHVFLDRMKAVERWGMQHVARARDLMEKVWKTGVPWEVLVDGEFFG